MTKVISFNNDNNIMYRDKKDIVGSSVCYFYANESQLEEIKKKPREYVVRNSKNSNSSMYHDRMFQWNSEKYRECQLKVFGNTSDYFQEKTFVDIEKFISMYLDKPVEIHSLTVYEHAISGFPIYLFKYYEEN